MGICVQPLVASYRGGYRKRIMLLLQARQEITKLCQLIKHAATTTTLTDTEKCNINDVGMMM